MVDARVMRFREHFYTNISAVQRLEAALDVRRQHICAPGPYMCAVRTTATAGAFLTVTAGEEDACTG